MSRTQRARRPAADGRPRDDKGRLVPEYERKLTGRMAPCPAGDMAYHAMLDNCGSCAPRWGEVPERAPVDFDEAKREGWAVSWADVPFELSDAVRADIRAGLAEDIHVTRRYRWGQQSYYVVRWMKPS